MGTEIADIEHHYQVTLQSTKKEDVDFWGINLMDVPGHELSYKVYRSQASSQCASHPLVDYIHRRGMLRYFADVADSTRPGVTRIDISLYQRNDANMESLFEYLTKYVPFFQPHVQQVKKVAEMKITAKPDYRYASVYHVGLIEDNSIPELLKFHFFTRWCHDPNCHGQDGFRDQEFWEFLQGADIGGYRILAQKAGMALENCGGHLWMAGMDISPDKLKYKIYIKDICHAYEHLPRIMGTAVAEQLKIIAEWNASHPECILVGAAFALDSNGVSSLNLYYQFD